MISQEMVKDILHYDEHSGIFTWKNRRRDYFKSDSSFLTWNKRFAGKTAGFLNKTSNGYKNIGICIMGKFYKAHRIAWLYMIGENIPEQIDHINQDATDNRWVNLRGSSGSSNGRNKSKQSNNTSGVTGVCRDKRSGKWMARGKLLGKTTYLGLFEDIKDAEKAVKQFWRDNDFDPNHGQELPHYAKEVS